MPSSHRSRPRGRRPAPGPVFTPSELPYPFSSAVLVGDVLYLSGQLGAEDGGGKVVPGGIGPESEQMFRRIGLTLTHHGLSFDDVFKCFVFQADWFRTHLAAIT